MVKNRVRIFGILIVFLLMIIPMTANGWIRTYEIGDLSVGNSIQQTANGGYIITGCGMYIAAGYSASEADSAGLLLMKTDFEGNILWKKFYGEGDNGIRVLQTSDGGYIIFSFANISDDMWPVGDIWLLKTDEDGDTLWTRLYKGAASVSGGWVEQTSDGGYILTCNWNRAYLHLLKTDKDGNTMWSHNYQWGQTTEIGYCVRQTADGGYIVATNLGLFRTDENGDSMWLKPLSATIHFVETTKDSGFILISGKHWGGDNSDIWLVKTDKYGDTLWTRTYGGDSADGASCIQQTTDGGYIIVGKTESYGDGSYADVWLLKTDSLGDTLWTRTFGSPWTDEGNCVQQTSDGGYIITGSGSFYCSEWDFSDLFLIKTDSTGDAGIAEPVPVTHQPDWEIVFSVGHNVVLRFHDRPQGFHAAVFDASGRKVDEIVSTNQSGSIVWGECYGPGVYFIQEKTQYHCSTRKVVLIQ